MMRALVPYLILALATVVAACAAGPDDGGGDRFPTSRDYPPGVMERVAFTAGVPEGWRLSTLRSGPRADAAWRIVVVSGTPSWSEFWAPTIARLPENLEMIVIDRPGFSASEPAEAVPDLAKQAAAFAPLLETDKPVLVLGQSFGAPIAALMAAEHPDRVKAVVLMSAYFGVPGPTARRLIGVGRIVRPLLPHDLRNALIEVTNQAPQLPAAWAALESLEAPVTFIHGGRDTFVSEAAARGFAETVHAEFVAAPEGDHFLQACCVEAVIGAIEGAIARAEAQETAP